MTTNTGDFPNNSNSSKGLGPEEPQLIPDSAGCNVLEQMQIEVPDSTEKFYAEMEMESLSRTHSALTPSMTATTTPSTSDTESIDPESPIPLPWLDYLDFNLEDFLGLITGHKTLDTECSSRSSVGSGSLNSSGSSPTFPFPANLRGSRGSYGYDDFRPHGTPARVNAQDLVGSGVRMGELTSSNVALINTVIKCYGQGLAMMDRDRERLEGRTPGGLALGWASSPSYSFFGFQPAYPKNGQGQRFF